MSFANHLGSMSDHDYCPVNHQSQDEITSKAGCDNEFNVESSSKLSCVEVPTDAISSQRHSPWQIVASNKRSSIVSSNQNSKKPRQLPSKNATQTENKFDVLSDTQDMEGLDSTEKKESKPPPLFIPDISNIKQMISSIESVIPRDEYTYKCLPGNKVKICPASITSYRQLVHKLTDLKVSFHTFQVKQDRAFRVVLKNMHFSTHVNDIKTSIEEHGHRVRHVTNIRDFKTKLPLSMFFIDLEPGQNNKEIYKVQYLLNAKIVFEPPRRKTDIVQCKKCQKYGHTKSYCWYPFRCVKCGLNHDSLTCAKPISEPPKCVLCEGAHPANYKGCAIYQELKNKMFPPLRQRPQKESRKMTENPPTLVPTRPTPVSVPHIHTPGESNDRPRTFAQIAASPNATSKDIEKCDSSILERTIQSFVDKFEKLLLQQTQQIGTLMNLLTTVINKLT